MRLLEVFLLMERTDRLNHIAQVMQKKIFGRWWKHMEEAGHAGLPRDWKRALDDGSLPDPMANDDWSDEHTEKLVDWIVKWFSQQDPSQNKKYTDWIIRQWLGDSLWLEDAHRMKSMLETFEAHKKNLKKLDIPDDAYAPPPERRGDINAWTDQRILSRILRPLTGTQAAGEKGLNFLKKPEIEQMIHWPVPDPEKAFGPEGDFDFDELRDNYVDDDGEDNFDTMDWYVGFVSQPDDDATTAIKLIYKSDRLAILQPNTKAAACELGKGTEWCTASTDSENYFWNYAPNGPLYVVLTDKMGKFQFQFDSAQFANVHDEMLKNEEKTALVQAYPELAEIFGDEAMDHNQMWLVDGAKWDVERVKEYMKTPEYSEESLRNAIKYWDGTAPEETLLALEKWVRKEAPDKAYNFVREATVEDYTDAVIAELEKGESSGFAHQDMLRILRHARDKGITLPDEAIGFAIAGDSRAIKHASIEQLQKHPEWILEASIEDETWLKISAAFVNNLPDTGTHDYLADPINEFVMEVFRDHPKGPAALANLTKRNPKLVRYYLDYFGTDPWKRAYMYANALTSSVPDSGTVITENNEMERMAEAISEHDMPNLDKVDLVVYLLKNGILHMGTFQAIEKSLGALPIEVQQALLKKSPAFINYINNPDPQLKAEAMKIMSLSANEYGKHTRSRGASPALTNFERNAYLDQELGESITEGVSPILYHVSQIHNVRDMLTDNAIRLTPDFGTGAEKEHQPEGKIYYLSTARSKTGSYGYPVSNSQKNGAMVVFDGQALMAAGYTGKAIDYWGPEFRKLGKDEMEDRIFSKKPVIPKASKYIKEIHILFDRDRTDHRNDHVARVLKDLGYKAKRLGVPLYIYTDQQAFALLNKAKAASVASVDAPADKLPLPDTDIEPRGYRGGPARNYFGGWIELLKVNDASRLSKAGKDALNRAHYFDANQGVDADIHNARTNHQRPHLDKFLAVLQQFKINSTTELMTYVNNKFN